MIRVPRPFDSERGSDAARAVPEVTGDLRVLIQGAAGCSPYLAGLIHKEAQWLPQALEAPDDALLALMVPPDPDVPDLKPRLRRAKRRVALLAGLAGRIIRIGWGLLTRNATGMGLLVQMGA